MIKKDNFFFCDLSQTLLIVEKGNFVMAVCDFKNPIQSQFFFINQGHCFFVMSHKHISDR